ncbi:MAG TPA: hypothetical protein VEA61_03945 [Allosphingosinicella sp.]|nr:hypothetical protein [Allosphingosinicella sp.]
MPPSSRLLAITAELHVFDEVVNWRQPLRLGLVLEGRPFLRIREQRGDSIGFDDRPLEAADLGEGGRVEVHDFTHRIDPTLRGAALDALRAIEGSDGRTLGLALILRNRRPFWIYIEDDEFHWTAEPALARRRSGIAWRLGRMI